MIALQEEYGPRRKRAGQLQDEARQPGWLSVRMTQGTPQDVVTDTSRMERVQQSGAIARLGWPQDTSTDWEGDIPKDQDKVRDCRERCSSWTGLDDLRGRQPPSPFLYVHFVPEQVNDMGLYSLLQHIVCAIEYTHSISVPIFILARIPTPLTPIHFVNTTLGWFCSGQVTTRKASPPFAQAFLKVLQPRRGPVQVICTAGPGRSHQHPRPPETQGGMDPSRHDHRLALCVLLSL